jgi:hypothetical protein
MTVSGSAAEFTEEVRTAYEENLADMLGCEPSKVSVTIDVGPEAKNAKLVSDKKSLK